MSLRQLRVAILIFYCSYFNSNIDSINQNLVLELLRSPCWSNKIRFKNDTQPLMLYIHHTKQQDKKIQHYLWTAPKKIASYHNWGWQQTKPQVSLLRLCSRPSARSPLIVTLICCVWLKLEQQSWFWHWWHIMRKN